VAVEANPTQVPLPSVVSPPSAPNLTSLLTGHVGQEVGNQASSDMNINAQEVEQVEDSAKSPKKKKSKKVKSTKEDTSTKRNRSGSSLKKSSFATQPMAATSSAKDYKFERVFYKAGLELKGKDKYSAYIKHIGNLLEHIQACGRQVRGRKASQLQVGNEYQHDRFLGVCAGGTQREGFSTKKE